MCLAHAKYIYWVNWQKEILLYITRIYRRPNQKKRQDKKMPCTEGTWKEERKVCPWQQFIHTENVFCTSCYFVLLSIGAEKPDNYFFLQIYQNYC